MASELQLMQMTTKAHGYFFDRAKVQRAMHKDNLKRLSKIGAYIRRRARHSLVRRKAISMPGRTPSVRSRDSFQTLKNILFAASPTWESVIVGPVAIPSMALKNSNRGTVPALMELGGNNRITMTLLGGMWVLGDARSKYRLAETKEVSANYPARPFMGPALYAEAEAGTLAGVYHNYPM